MKDLTMWVGSFSHSQQCFDVDTLDSYLERSRKQIFKKIPFDYVIIGIFDSHEKASEACQLMRNACGIKDVFERFSEERCK